jgi:hypothetical protein
VSTVNTNVGVRVLTKGPRNSTVVRNDMIEAGNSTKVVGV